MNKRNTSDETLRELWAIKDETAARFRTAGEYLRHLGLKQPRQKKVKDSASAKRGPVREGGIRIKSVV